MIPSFLILVLAVVVWKGYYAFLRAMNSYRLDCQQHDSLREYLLANGATPKVMTNLDSIKKIIIKK